MVCFGQGASVVKVSTPGKYCVQKDGACPVKQLARRLLNTIIRLLTASPEPRTYEGNPSAGAEPGTAEKDYAEAQRGTKGKDYVVSHTWRW